MHVHISRIGAQQTAVRSDVIVEPTRAIYICKKKCALALVSKKSSYGRSCWFGLWLCKGRDSFTSQRFFFLPLNQTGGKLARGLRYGGRPLRYISYPIYLPYFAAEVLIHAGVVI